VANSDPVLRLLSLHSGGGVKDRIEDPDWTELPGDVIATGATGAKLDATTQTTAKRFYRVVASP